MSYIANTVSIPDTHALWKAYWENNNPPVTAKYRPKTPNLGKEFRFG